MVIWSTTLRWLQYGLMKGYAHDSSEVLSFELPIKWRRIYSGTGVRHQSSGYRSLRSYGDGRQWANSCNYSTPTGTGSFCPTLKE